MSKRVAISILATVVAATMLASGVGLASAAGAKPRVVPIVMRDPGCHWFQAGGKYKLRLAVNGKTTFRNLDEAALIFKGKNFVRQVPVGKSLTIAKRGVYHITMVDQAPDDNHLVLIVK